MLRSYLERVPKRLNWERRKPHLHLSFLDRWWKRFWRKKRLPPQVEMWTLMWGLNLQICGWPPAKVPPGRKYLIYKQKLKSKLSQENQRWNMFMLDQRGYCCRNIFINIYLPAQVLMFHHRQLKWDTDIKKKNPNGIRDIKAGGVVGNRRVTGI